MRLIFVFGSNLAGVHGAGAARAAANGYGAACGVGVGRTGDAYAIPTKSATIRTLPLDKIKPFVDAFRKYAEDNPHLCFLVTKVGCGLAGYRNEDMAPMFKGLPGNCHVSTDWKEWI